MPKLGQTPPRRADSDRLTATLRPVTRMLTLVANSAPVRRCPAMGGICEKARRSPGASESKIDSWLGPVAQERLVSDQIPTLSDRSRLVDHFEAAESMGGTPA